MCFLTYILGLVTHFFPFLLRYEIYEGLVVRAFDLWLTCFRSRRSIDSLWVSIVIITFGTSIKDMTLEIVRLYDFDVSVGPCLIEFLGRIILLYRRLWFRYFYTLPFWKSITYIKNLGRKRKTNLVHLLQWQFWNLWFSYPILLGRIIFFARLYSEYLEFSKKVLSHIWNGQ